MFYDFPPSSDPIQQGDIFVNIPCVTLDSWDEISVLEKGDKLVNLAWEEIVNDNKDAVAILGIDPVPAIVATQTCDAQRIEHITLCQIIKLSNIKSFADYESKLTKNLAKDLIKRNKEMPGIFYLPPDNRVGFPKKMVVAFANTIRVRRKALEKFVANRNGRLNRYVYDHFREKLSHFFRRHAFNEWYILNKEELDAHPRYSTYPPEKRFDWQK